MSTQDIRAFVQRDFELLDQRKLVECAQNYAPTIRIHGFGPEPIGLDGGKHGMEELLAAFPDSHFTVDDVVVEGEKAAIRHTFAGTHKGEFQGIPPTGKSVVINGIEIQHIVDGKLVEAWLNVDFMGMMQQLGVIPVQEEAG